MSHLYATHIEQAKGRLIPETASPFRNDFQRDRDRLIHCTAFRRLEYKTQVFVNSEGDHYRTRLTHTLEVAQISRVIANALGLNEALTEVIALAHDLGHPPFGHAGEDALNLKMQAYGGFDHNAHTLKILTQLEQRYAHFDGLNLTWETLEGILKHNGPLKGPYAKTPQKPISNYVMQLDAQYHFHLETFGSMESQVASLADDIAYIAHDLEDGLRADLLFPSDLLALPLFGTILEETLQRFADAPWQRQMYQAISAFTNDLVINLLTETRQRIAEENIRTIKDVRHARREIVAFSDAYSTAIQAIKACLMQRVYRHYQVSRMTSRAKRVLSALFDIYFNEPECLPTAWQPAITPVPPHQLASIVADFIAGMTDRYAYKEFEQLCSPSFKF